MNQAKVSATRLGAVRHSQIDVDYCAKVEIEWVFLYGVSYRAGKYLSKVMDSKNEQDFKDAIKEDLLTHLQTIFPSEDLKLKDVMLFGL